MLGSPMRDAKQAEDIVQDTLIKLFRHRDTYDWSDGGWSLMAKAVARNVISCRRRKVGTSLEADPALSDGLGAENDPAAAPITVETIQTVRRHIESLPPAWREALVLREQQELGYREIAEILDATESQVKTWLHRARVRLAESLRDHLREK
ncbi:MAG TPA: sigma-70 family RNA polymerase sigma factor [Phycisphaerae bacterium]|nr:sigma-70 family RNA polymerase sigma factor [Phycisphaerae bacterium]